MAVRGRGLVIHITSDAAVSAYPTWGAYGASSHFSPRSGKGQGKCK